jgi:glycerol-3-phosphate acyltransferase PlsY
MSLPHEAVYAAAGLVTYFAGALPFGWLAARFAKGVDLRTVGSGNIGATNAARVLGLGWFFPIFALDFLKGFAPVFWLAPWVAEQWPCPT